MAVTQRHYRGRGDAHPLNSPIFTYEPNSGWSQQTERTFRVRFEVGGTGDVDGQLEARLNGGSWFSVTPTSGTVVAALSSHFYEGDRTTAVVKSLETGFVSGYGATDGDTPTVSLADGQTELEYALRVTGIATGGTVELRVNGLDTYNQTPSLISFVLSDRDRVRLKCGDSDGTDRLTDAEVDAFVVAWPENPDLAAADAAEAIAGKYADGFNFTTDGQSFNRRERVEHYMNLAATLRKRGGTFEWPR